MNIYFHIRLRLIMLHNCGHTKWDVLHSTVDYKNFVALMWKLAENVNKISQDYCPITYLKHSTFPLILIGRVLLLSKQSRREGMTTGRGACGGLYLFSGHNLPLPLLQVILFAIDCTIFNLTIFTQLYMNCFVSS